MTSYDGMFSAILTGREGDVPTDVWSRPETFSIDGDTLVLDGEFRIAVRSGPGMLLHFTKLKTASDIKRYASKWGPLGLCHEHPQWPVAHGRTSSAHVLRNADVQAMTYEPGCGDFASREPLEAWLCYVGCFRGLLQIALKQLRSPGENLTPKSLAELASGRSRLSRDEVFAAFPDLEQVAAGLVGRQSMSFLPWLTTSHLASRVTKFLEMTGSRIGLAWSMDGRPQLRFGAVEPTLLGALALQLAFTIAGEPDTFFCSTCGKPFDPSEQRVRRGFRQYCQECRESGAPQREAARRYRDRNKKRGKK